jgi:cation transport ATPase
MGTLKFSTNLHCADCVRKVKPFLDSDPDIKTWSVDTENPEKILTVSGNANAQTIRGLVEKSGFKIENELPSTKNSTPKSFLNAVQKYYPLALILFYMLMITGLIQWRRGTWSTHEFMYDFMASFFLIFSFFKLLNVRAFKEAYEGYDIIAMRWPMYGYIYPLIELSFGFLYLTRSALQFTNIVMFSVMAVGSIGIARALLKKRSIQCACLGTVINLPMTTISLLEDILMLVMAGFMLLE